MFKPLTEWLRGTVGSVPEPRHEPAPVQEMVPERKLVHPMVRSSSTTVLLVEDHETTQTLFACALREEGFTVLTARDVEEAMRCARRHPGPIDLILADILVPRTTGLQLRSSGKPLVSQKMGLAWIRDVMAARPEARVLLMSGHSDEELESFGVFRQRWPFLRKPFGTGTLSEAVRRVLAQ